MIRRVPTPIDLKFDDIREYEAIRKGINSTKNTATNGEGTSSQPHFVSVDSKTAQDIRRRLGITPLTTP